MAWTTSGSPSRPTQCSGSDEPTSPILAARAFTPLRKSDGNVASDNAGTPSAARPLNVNAMLSVLGGVVRPPRSGGDLGNRRIVTGHRAEELDHGRRIVDLHHDVPDERVGVSPCHPPLDVGRVDLAGVRRSVHNVTSRVRALGGSAPRCNRDTTGRPRAGSRGRHRTTAPPCGAASRGRDRVTARRRTAADRARRPNR